MKWYSSIGSLLFHRVLVTIASHFLNSPPKPYMQWYSSMHILPFHRVLVTIANHFLNFLPKALHALVVLNANPSLS